MIVESEKIVSMPAVSVIVTTYNHAQYIDECMSHILSQKFNQDYEIIIAEDCSTDETREICKRYQQQYPNKIRLLLQETNQGFMRNYASLLNLCRGKYIAVCSGDDYWCDDKKLQKQFDCLESKAGYGFVRTWGYELHDNQLLETAGGHMDNEGNVRDIAIYGPLGFASSAFFERDLLKYFDMGELIRRGITMEDYPMHAIFSHHTKFALIPERMVVYRILNSSVSHQKSVEKATKYMLGLQEARRYIKEMFPDECPWSIEEVNDAQEYARLRLYYYTHDYTDAKLTSFSTQQYLKKWLVRFKNHIMSFYLLSLLFRFKLNHNA